MHRETDTSESAVSGENAPATSDSKRQLLEFLQNSAAALLGTLRSYVHRMGLASGEAVHAAALEVLQETVIEALAHADRFTPTRQPMAWLLGIALNIIKRKKVELAKRHHRELQLSTLYPESMSESDLLDEITSTTLASPEITIEANEQANALLSLVSTDDQEVLRLAFLEDFERDALAQRLGTTPGTARMRLHRALSRLRAAWREQQMTRQKGEDDA